MFDEINNEEIKSKELEINRYDRYLINGDISHPLIKDQNIIKSKLRPGMYHVSSDMSNRISFETITLSTDVIIDLPDPAMKSVLKTVNQFWGEEASLKYKEYGITRKLGVLLHGLPGTGKTIIAARLSKEIMKMGGIVLFNPPVRILQQALKVIRQIEPDKKIMVLFEEFDSTLREDEQELLCLMDGEMQVEDVIFIATTNYITRIPARFKARPSRFAKVIEIKPPSEDVRRAYFSALIKHETDKTKYLESFVETSDGMSIDMCKDLLLSVLIYKESVSDAVMNIKNVQKEHYSGVDDYNEERTKEIFKLSSQDREEKRPLRGL